MIETPERNLQQNKDKDFVINESTNMQRKWSKTNLKTKKFARESKAKQEKMLREGNE